MQRNHLHHRCLKLTRSQRDWAFRRGLGRRTWHGKREAVEAVLTGIGRENWLTLRNVHNSIPNRRVGGLGSHA
jgi:hypothetical protein